MEKTNFQKLIFLISETENVNFFEIENIFLFSFQLFIICGNFIDISLSLSFIWLNYLSYVIFTLSLY